jgi:hypothetical protein
MKKFAWILMAMSMFSIMLAGCAAETEEAENGAEAAEETTDDE